MAKENLRCCLNFFDKNIQPILIKIAVNSRESLKNDSFDESREIINFENKNKSGLGHLLEAYKLLGKGTVTKESLKGLIPEKVREVLEDSIKEDRLKQLILDEIVDKQREYNSKVQFACKEINLQQYNYTSWEDIVEDLDRLITDRAERYDKNNYEYRLSGYRQAIKDKEVTPPFWEKINTWK